VMDECGANRHSKDDKNCGAEKLMVPTGVQPRQEAAIKDDHFTCFPVNNLLGELVMMVIIFSGKELKQEWCFGLDVFWKRMVSGLANDFPAAQLFKLMAGRFRVSLQPVQKDQ
jgi:hypothetical protein